MKKLGVLSGLLVLGLASSNIVEARTGGAAAMRATKAEKAAIRTIERAAQRAPALRNVAEHIHAENARGALDIGSAKQMAATIAIAASTLGLTASDIAALPTEAEIAAEMAALPNSKVVFVDASSTQNGSALSLMEGLNNADAKLNCDMALGASAVSSDGLSIDETVVIDTASEATTAYVDMLSFYQMDENGQLVARNFVDLVNSAPSAEGAQAQAKPDADVAAGLGAIFGPAGIVTISERIAVMAEDGLDATEKSTIASCGMAWGTAGLAVEKGLKPEEASGLARDLGASCSIYTSGQQMTAEQIASTCKI